MDRVRAQILTGCPPLTAAARIVIDAQPHIIFDLLADPRAHAYFDGSSTVQKALRAPERLSLGAQFSMGMRIYVPYRIKNTVTEFSENRRVSWKHLGGWTWSYELREIKDGRTEVTETFDLGTAGPLGQWWANRTDSLSRNPKWMAKSLVLLKAICEA